MKKNKIISILEYSTKNRIVILLLIATLVGGAGVILSNQKNSFNINSINSNVLLGGSLNINSNKACVINAGANLYMYSSADNNSKVISNVSNGEMLTINSEENGYYNVTTETTNVTGYIKSSNVQEILSGVNDSLQSVSGTGYTTNVSTGVNLREDASINSPSLLKLKNNIPVTLIGEKGNWYKVNYNGKVGYIYSEYIVLSDNLAYNCNNSKESLPKNLAKINVPSGECYYALGNYSKNYGINENTLREKIYNLIKDKISNNGYITLSNEEENTITSGSGEAKQELINKYGADALIINVTLNSKLPTVGEQTVYPQEFYNGEFFYQFQVATLGELCNNVDNWCQYSGVVSTNWELPSMSNFNNGLKNDEVYILNLNEPSWYNYSINI